MIKAQDIVESIADAFQFISYYHPKDFIDAVFSAYKKEQSPAAKDALRKSLLIANMRYGKASNLSGHRNSNNLCKNRSRM